LMDYFWTVEQSEFQERRMLKWIMKIPCSAMQPWGSWHTFWEIAEGDMLPMQFSTYLCNIGKTCIYPAISLSPLGMVMGLDCSWDSVAVTGEPASWLSGHGILRSLSVLPCQGNSVYLHRKLAANP
jgi:hypothetical protein